jgi:hypothetical protein
MANYTTANLVKAQLALNGSVAAQDTRFRIPAVWMLFLANLEQFIPNADALRTREDRAIETNYFKASARSLSSGRSHNHTGTHGDSGTLTPTFNTYSDPFTMSLKQADNSIYSIQQELDNELLNAIANFMNGLDDLASDALFNNRSGVNIATAEGTFDATNDVFEITDSTHGLRAVQIAKMVMDINKYQGMNLTFVCDSIAYNKFMYTAAQGISNATNYSFQFMGCNFVHDPSLTAKALALDATYTKGFWEVVPQNTIGALTWIPKQNRVGEVTPVSVYSSLVNPYDGRQYALHTYQTAADGTATNGYTQDVVTQFEISLDVALVIAPLSTATETPILAFALV